MTKSDASTPVQAILFKVLLRDIVYPQHELIHGSAPDIAAQAASLKELLKSHNIEPRVWKGELVTVIGCVGDIAHLDPGLNKALDVVETVQRITRIRSVL